MKRFSPIPRRVWRTAGLAAVLTVTPFSVGAAQSAVRTESTPYLPQAHLDVRNQVSPTAHVSASQRAIIARLGARMQFNPRNGVPFVIMKDGETLTRPSRNRPESIARAFLRSHASLYGLSA